MRHMKRMAITSFTSFAEIIECFKKGCLLRCRCGIKFASVNHHLRCNGVKVTLNGFSRPVNCCVPTFNASDVVVVPGCRKNEHQDRIPQQILDTFEKTVGKLTFSHFSNFEDLFKFVANNCGLKNGCCLLTYDFCIRYGQKYGIEPKDYVYLFQGAKEGAKAVFGNISNVFRVETTEFHTELKDKSLTSIDIENLLCVCSDHLHFVRKYCLKKPGRKIKIKPIYNRL